MATCPTCKKDFPDSERKRTPVGWAKECPNCFAKTVAKEWARAQENAPARLEEWAPTRENAPIGLRGPESTSTRYPVLSALSLGLRIVGWLTAVGGVFFLLYAASQSDRPAELLAAAVAGVPVILGGLFVVAVGESLAVLGDIEQNTRGTRKLLSSMLGQTAFRRLAESDKGDDPHP